jgi:outer membrane protein OmpA-like peptidoglycan-associated protein
MYKLTTITALFLFSYGVLSAQLTETHSVYFEIDKDVIVTSEGKQLNSFFDELLYKPILDVKILGYCDDRGSYEYNIKLSNRRVETVSRWLQEHNITVAHISKTVEGKGEIALRKNTAVSVADERAHNRRVDITFSLAAQVVDRLAIKKLNREELTTGESELIESYQKKVVEAFDKNPNGEKVIELEKPDIEDLSELSEDEFLIIPTKIDPLIDNTQEPFKSLLSKKLQKGQVIRLENILFYRGRSTILEESQPLLDRVAEILNARKDIKFEIHGHVCCINPVYEDAYNRDTKKSNLSHDRAKAIYQILRKRGINHSRMRFKGFGRTKPLGGIDKLDRRVELYITAIDHS